MNITVHKIEVNPRSIERELLIDIIIEYREYYELPISFNAIIIGDQGKKLGDCLEVPNKSLNRSIELPPLDFAESRHKNNSTNANIKVSFSFLVTDRALEHIENRRLESSDGNVKLTLKVLTKYVTTSMKARDRTSQYNLINYYHSEAYAEYTIARSDWIQHFSEKLDIGKILIIEHNVNKLAELIKNISPEIPDTILEKMEISMDLLREMEDCLRDGNWKQVLRNAREFFELVKVGRQSNFRSQMLQYFKVRNGSEVGFKELYDGIHQFHEYMSKFIHHISQQGQLHVKPKAQQEDAYFIYSLCNSVLYLVLNKLS